MKKLFILVFLFLYVSVYAQQQSRFIIGAEHVSSFADFGGPLLHSNSFWDTVKAFGLNYAGLKYFQQYPVNPPHTYGYIPRADIIADLDKAASRDIDVYLTNGFDRNPAGESYYPKRWLYQVEKVNNGFDDYSNRPVGANGQTQDADALAHWSLAPPPPQGVFNFWHLDPAKHSPGIVANNLREKNLQPDGLNYYLKVRMRLPGAASYPNINILTVRVKKTGGSSFERTINANEFSNNNWKEVFVRSYNKTPNGPAEFMTNINEAAVYNFTDNIGTVQLKNYSAKTDVTFTDYDIEIEWLNTAPYNFTVDIDYVAVDDETAHSLYQNQFDSRIIDFANNYKNHSAVKNFMAWDEAYKENLFPISQIQSVFNSQNIGSKNPLSYRYFYNDSEFQTKRYLHETKMQVLLSDVYPIPINFVEPGGLNYTSNLQSRLQTYLIQLLGDLITNSKSFNNPFWFTVQAHKWAVQPDEVWLREPSAYEIKAMANLGVCYGAKGINYYIYSNNSNSGTDDRIGLLDFNGTATNPPIPRYTDAYGYSKWETVKQLNQKLAAIGGELMSLNWQGAKSWHNGNTAGTWSGLISNINTNISGETLYIETGHFINSSNVDYCFMVNRLTLPTDQRNINVTINKSSSAYINWKVSEVSTSNSWVIPKTGNFTANFQQSEGKLFKIAAVMLAGGTLAINETISNSLLMGGDIIVPTGVTLTLAANSVINPNGFSIVSTGGTITIQSGATVNGAILKTGSTVKAIYPTMQAALSVATSGQTVGVNIAQTVASNLSIQSGVTLSLGSNATITFGSAKKISVYGGGNLTANGATFKGNGSKGYWHSLSFFANSSGTIQSSTIKDAQCGIYATTNANVIISNNTITNNSLYGISSLNNATINVSNCTISNNGTGINANSITSSITGNSILNNTNYGISATAISIYDEWYSNTFHGNGYAMALNNASPWIAYNTICDNTYGVVINSSLPNFCDYSEGGYNAITYSSIPLFRANNSSSVVLGYWSQGGYNSVFGSELPDMEALNSSHISADNTYWGSSQPAVLADGTSWITTRTPLSSDPNPTSCSGSGAQSSFIAVKANISSTLDDKAVKYVEAITSGREGYFQKAKKTLLTLIEGEFDRKYSPLALLAFYEFTFKERYIKGKGTALDSLNNELNDILAKVTKRAKDDSLRPFALRFLAREAALANNTLEMLSYNKEIVSSYPNSSNELSALFDLITHYTDVEQDVTKTDEYYTRMVKAYPDEDLTKFAAINLGKNKRSLKKGTVLVQREKEY